MSDQPEAHVTNPPEYTLIIPRFGAPECLVGSKSELQQEIQQSGGELPTYENKNYGEPHSYRWSSTILFKSGSRVSISPIFKSKKDADKAAAFKAKKIGIAHLINETIEANENFEEDIGMILKCFEECGSEVDPDIEQAYKSGKYKSVNPKSLIPTVVVNNPISPSPTLPSGTNEVIGCVRREYNTDGRKFLDGEGQLELPFVFPIANDGDDFVTAICERCLKSETQRRQIFAYGRLASWRIAWMRSLSNCIANRGIIVVSPETESAVVESLKSFIDSKSIVHIQSPGTEVDPPVSCVMNSEVLRQVNLNKLFPTERPILLIDSSVKWTVTWQLLVFFPTFHIASYCLYESESSSPVIQINMLRDIYNCDLITQISYVC